MVAFIASISLSRRSVCDATMRNAAVPRLPSAVRPRRTPRHTVDSPAAPQPITATVAAGSTLAALDTVLLGGAALDDGARP
jgi:hypothetical protein